MSDSNAHVFLCIIRAPTVCAGDVAEEMFFINEVVEVVVPINGKDTVVVFLMATVLAKQLSLQIDLDQRQ